MEQTADYLSGMRQLVHEKLSDVKNGRVNFGKLRGDETLVFGEMKILILLMIK